MEEVSKEKLLIQLQSEFEKDAEKFNNLLDKIHNRDEICELNYEQSHLLTNAELPKPSCELGSLLMEELTDPKYADVVLNVSGERFLCHKCVLQERSQYFDLMFKQFWREKDCEEISMDNITPSSAAALLCFLYGNSPELPSFCSLLEVMRVSDMLGVTGLMAIAGKHIRLKMCHSFHKPCQECVENFPDVLAMTSMFLMESLHGSLMSWNAKHFSKLWPTKKFASLPKELQRKCLNGVEQSITSLNAAHLLMETDKLLSGITRVQWTKPLVTVTSDLMTSCVEYITTHFLEVTSNKTILVLFQGMGWKTDVIQRIVEQIILNLTVQNVCEKHIAVSRLMYLAEKEKWNKDLQELLQEMKTKVWSYLVSNYFTVIHTEAWHHVPSDDKRASKAFNKPGDKKSRLKDRGSFKKSAASSDPENATPSQPLKRIQRDYTAPRSIEVVEQMFWSSSFIDESVRARDMQLNCDHG